MEKLVYGNVGVIPYLDSDSIITGDTKMVLMVVYVILCIIHID